MNKSNINLSRHCSFCGKTKFEVRKIIASSSVCICNECVAACCDLLDKENIKLKTSHERESEPADSQYDLEDLNSLPKPRDIHSYLDEYVVGQSYAKKVLSVGVYNHYKRILSEGNFEDDVEIEKSNILLIGPTGSGKTLLGRKLAAFLHVPFLIVDATKLTEAGYVGEDVDNMIQDLLQRCGYNVKKAEMAIIYIDEIDKIVRKRGSNLSATRDPSGEGVQQALLKLIEGSLISVPKQGQRKYNQSESIEVNTQNILFICGGAFSDLDKIILERTQYAGIGFSAEVISHENKEKLSETLKKVQSDDLIKYGLIPEFIGRLPIVGVLEELNESILIAILMEPKDAIIKQYQKLFMMEGVEVEFEEEALAAIAKLAESRKTGARGLRSILEATLLDTMYELPSVKGLRKIIVNASVVTDQNKPLLIYDANVRKTEQEGI